MAEPSLEIPYVAPENSDNNAPVGVHQQGMLKDAQMRARLDNVTATRRSILNPRTWLSSYYGIALLLIMTLFAGLLLINPPFVQKNSTSDVERRQPSFTRIAAISVGLGVACLGIGIATDSYNLTQYQKDRTAALTT